MVDETVSYDRKDGHRQAMEFPGYEVLGFPLKKRLGGYNPVLFQRWKLHRFTGKVLKRSLDLAGASAGLAMLIPLFALIAIAIKSTSRGPVFFLQQRHGLNGALFTVLKFRTMHLHMCDNSGISQTVENDPRVTWVGRFLRSSNFDELPQLLNVLKGDMSLVGPRPHVPGMLAAGVQYEAFDARYMDRHRVRPGITGLAQVNGFRGETKDRHAARMRLEHDLSYIERQSVLLDVKILADTVVQEFFGGSGY
ncbi:sugar transferase [Roseibium marinum]|uniref:Lipopolysaccharide/colanic/teichoic acid biosynthesis glycosyltransferase n=1 Tax=Roseibium marinum TaxID=281252 RepID=A0A2S3UXE6_9HYPH|nr:sugar transferase [Roseibium marinum]POF32139.1 lipopolysaccharide/colanic/teichoic acid biosynthesis glycosyltransferase [Roseibium marinum]